MQQQAVSSGRDQPRATAAQPVGAGAERDGGACPQIGLTPGTPAFAVCVVTAEQSPADVVLPLRELC